MPKKIEEYPEGGMGIIIMWRIADKLTYTRHSDQKNCLLIQKKYQQQGGWSNGLMNFVNPLKSLSCGWKGAKSWDAPLQKMSFQVKTEIQALTEILKWFDQFEHEQINKQVWWQCQTALAEGFTNAVRHSHQGLPKETPIEIEVAIFGQYLEIKIWDYGKPFDLEAYLARKLQEEIEPVEFPEEELSVLLPMGLTERVS